MALLFAISMIGSAASVTCYLSYRVALLSQLRREFPRLFEELGPHDSPGMWLGVIPDDTPLERLESYGSTVATSSSVARYVNLQLIPLLSLRLHIALSVWPVVVSVAMRASHCTRGPMDWRAP